MAGQVSTAVAQRETAVAPAVELRRKIENTGPEFAKALPAHITAEHFVRTALTLLHRVPKLAECEHNSVVLGLLDAARLGLEISDVRGQAYLIPRGTRVKDSQGNWGDGPMTATFQLGYRGCIDLAARAGITVSATEIREYDQYDVERGTSPRLIHRPPLGHRGNVIAYYAVATMPDGRVQFEVMTVSEVEEHRDKFASRRNFKTKQIEGPWVDDFDAMARKTLILKVLNYMPQALEFRRAMAIEATADDAPEPAQLTATHRTPPTAGALPAGTPELDPPRPPAEGAPEAGAEAGGEPEPPPPPAETTAAPKAGKQQTAPPKSTPRESLEQYGDVTDTTATEGAPAPGGDRAMSIDELIVKLAAAHGVKDTGERARMASQIVGREVVRSSKDLSTAEKQKVKRFLEGLAEDAEFPWAAGSPVTEVQGSESTLSDAKADAAVSPPLSPASVSPNSWDSTVWRKKIAGANLKVSAVMPEAKRLGLALSPPVQIATLDEIAGTGVGEDLYGWLEDNALPGGGS